MIKAKAVLLLLALLAPVAFAPGAQARDLAIWDRIQGTSPKGYVLLMRHALAPGVGDPAGYKLDDCKTQRNLDSQGRAQAQKTGQWLKAQGVQDALVFTSAWCRCKETADKLGLSVPVQETSLNSFFDDMRQGPQSNVRLQKFIAAQLKSKGDKALILVTHHVNIAELMGENVGSGDMVLVKVNSQGQRISHKVYPSPS